MTRGRSLAAALSLWAGVATAVRQDTPAPARPPSSLVTAHVLVTVADSGAAVSNLTAEDCEVWSDGVPVTIQRFSRERGELSLLLLIDASASAIETWDVAVDSLTTFIPPINNGLVANLWSGDRLGLGVFGRQVHLGREFASEQAAVTLLERDVLRMDDRERFGPSPIWDAVDVATDVLAVRPDPRDVILVTDGKATGNRKSLSAVIDHAMESDVAVSVVAQGTFLMPPDVTANAPAVNLALLANATGGLVIAGGTQTSLFARILNQLHHTYSIGFTPPVLDGAAHRLQVHVKKVGVQTHVRSQYWAGRTP